MQGSFKHGYRYSRPVVSSSSWANQILPDPDGPPSERVTTKAIEFPNAEILHVYKGVYECSWHNAYCTGHTGEWLFFALYSY